MLPIRHGMKRGVHLIRCGPSCMHPRISAACDFLCPDWARNFLLQILYWAVGRQTGSAARPLNNNNNNRRLVTLAEHTSDHSLGPLAYIISQQAGADKRQLIAFHLLCHWSEELYAFKYLN